MYDTADVHMVEPNVDNEEAKEHERKYVPVRNAYKKRVQLRRAAACEIARKRRSEKRKAKRQQRVVVDVDMPNHNNTPGTLNESSLALVFLVQFP